MEIKILEEKARRLVFEIDSDHGFCNVLKNELQKTKGVNVATYAIDHPLIGKPRFVVETDTSIEPKAAVKKALDSLKKQAADFKKEVKKLK
ncbi:DNA-directed RNA polymerase subunit L [Candidatus Woesearchaeota archaeon]|nr:DNA-directed RNA polymerase subunit L [Candidatus Woesearchaeota archaeon]